MASRERLVEVNRAVRESGIDERGVHAPVIGFARDLARRLDRVGVDEAPLNLLKLYQSALKDLQRAIAPAPAPRQARDAGETGPSEVPEPSGPPALTIVEESPLDKVRRNKARAAG